jgi:hypothetical protein
MEHANARLHVHQRIYTVQLRKIFVFISCEITVSLKITFDYSDNEVNSRYLWRNAITNSSLLTLNLQFHAVGMGSGSIAIYMLRHIHRPYWSEEDISLQRPNSESVGSKVSIYEYMDVHSFCPIYPEDSGNTYLQNIGNTVKFHTV